MSDRLTELIYTDPETDVYESLLEMYENPLVGGVALSRCLTAEEVERYTQTEGRGFSEAPRLQGVYQAVARSLKASSFTLVEQGPYHFGNPWHIAATTPEPVVKLWVDFEGGVGISLARALPDTPPGTPVPPTAVLAEAEASPITYRPRPGDGLLFIDMGTPKVTGTSTFHKTEVARGVGLDRLSMGCDIHPTAA